MTSYCWYGNYSLINSYLLLVSFAAVVWARHGEGSLRDEPRQRLRRKLISSETLIFLYFSYNINLPSDSWWWYSSCIKVERYRGHSKTRSSHLNNHLSACLEKKLFQESNLHGKNYYISSRQFNVDAIQSDVCSVKHKLSKQWAQHHFDRFRKVFY